MANQPNQDQNLTEEERKKRKEQRKNQPGQDATDEEKQMGREDLDEVEE